jgi:hypothetical protein
VTDETADEVLCGLTAGAELPCERGGWNTLRTEVGEHQRLGGGQPRPGILLEPVEELPVEPAAGSEQEQRERFRWHGVRLPDIIGRQVT